MLASASVGTTTDQLLEKVLAELQAIRSALERGRDQPPTRLTRVDRDRLAAILPAIAGALGSDLFTAKELLEQPAPAVRLVLGPLTARQLGRLLQRAEGAPVAGYLVQRDGTEVGAVLWRVLAAPA